MLFSCSRIFSQSYHIQESYPFMQNNLTVPLATFLNCLSNNGLSKSGIFLFVFSFSPIFDIMYNVQFSNYCIWAKINKIKQVSLPTLLYNLIFYDNVKCAVQRSSILLQNTIVQDGILYSMYSEKYCIQIPFFNLLLTL